MVKKLLFIIVILVLLLVAGITIFIITFDVNRYKPLLIQKLEKQLGRPVSVGGMSLGWNGGMALQVGPIAVYPDREGKKEPEITLEKAAAQVKLMPLLQKKIEITSIVLSKPYILIEKRPDGTLSAGGLTPSAAGKAGSKLEPSKIPIALSIQEFRVVDAHVVYRDQTVSPPLEVEIQNMDVHVRDFSLTAPFLFDGKLSVFSDTQNVSFEGRAELPREGQNASPLKELTLTTDLSNVDSQKLERAIPAVRSVGLQNKMKGEFKARVEGDEISVTLKEGSAKLKNIKSGFDHIFIDADLNKDLLTLKRVQTEFAGGLIKASGQVKALGSPAPPISLDVNCEAIGIDQVITVINPNAPTLDGKLSFSFEGAASGIQWPQISRSLNGTARVRLEEGVFLNYNALREVIGKLSIIPGVEEQIRNNFPQVYRSMINERHTFLKPVDVTASVQNGVFYFNPLVLQTDALAIVGAGQFGLSDFFLGVNASLRLNSELSGYLMAVAGQLGVLANAQGQFEIPLTLEGRLPQVRIIPDTQYIASRLLASKTQELVAGLVRDPKQGVNALKGILGKATGAATSATSQS